MNGVVQAIRSSVVTMVCAASGAALDHTVDICAISINGAPAELKDVRVGDKVELTIKNHSVVQMDVTRPVVKEEPKEEVKPKTVVESAVVKK